MKAHKLRKDDFYLPVLRALDELGGSGGVEEIDTKVIEATEMTAEDLDATYEKSGASIVPDKISWARSYLRQGGLLESKGRGVWVLTEEGRLALSTGEAAVHKAVADAMREYRKAYYANKTSQKAAAGETGEAEGETGDASAWSDQLLIKLQSIDPAAFERLCQRLLRESGFVRVEVTGKSGDGGIDGHGVLRMNLISFQVLFQCKRYKGSVSAGTVRDFRGAMQGRADKGLIITTGTFTPDARREATRDGAPAIDLIDGEALTDLLRGLKLGVRVEQVVTERVTIEEQFFDEI
jgi:restriction system protein